MIRLLHTADLHLDWGFTGMPASRRSLRRREVISVFYQMISLAIERKVHGMLIAGDLLQSQMPPQEQRSALVAGFSRLADQGIPVFIVPGHDEARLRILEWLELPGNVCVLGGEDNNTSNLIPDLTIYGFPADSTVDSPPLQNFHRLDRPGLHLGLLHGTYQGLPGPTADDDWQPIAPEHIARSGLDYLALGHYHDYFTIAHGGTHIAYPGSPARLDFGQSAARTALLVTLGEGPPNLERLTLRDRPYQEAHYDLSQVSLPEILADLEAKADPEACVRVFLTGKIRDEVLFFADRVLERCGSLFFFLEVRDQTEIALSPAGNTIEDLYIRRFQASLAEPDLSPEERAIEEYAFRAGLIALKGGRL